ncbi:lysophospholipid acyltransferase family protein [Methyloglobulus sp.]|uniref:lysophospholipid acyltransferase family protein n=1 Tax=Methyloglobulus sp. TaxID=2518622 RepID=UPI0032B7E396
MKLKLRLCYKVVLIALLFTSGLIIAAIIFPALGVLCKPSKAKRNRDTLKLTWLKWFCTILRLQITTEGVSPDKTCLLVSNHISWLDIVVLGCLIPAHFVAKSDILAWPIIGYLAKQGGTIFVRRGNKQQVKAITEEMLWLLKQNSTVIAFPEGTTTNGDVVLPFHASLFQSALLTKSTIQPVAIQYVGEARQLAPFIGEDVFVPHLIKMLSLDKIEVRVVFLHTINAAGKNRQSVSNEARAMIVASVAGEFPDAAIPLLKRQHNLH